MDIKQLITEFKLTLIAKQAKVDKFPIDSVYRDEDGRICAASTIVTETKTPSPLFGYDFRKKDNASEGLAYAVSQAKGKKVAKHNFGACTLMNKAFINIDGTWYGKVSVPETHQRAPKVTKYLVKADADGNATLDEKGNETLLRDDDGKVITTPGVQKESFLLVPMADLKPDFDHPLSCDYNQSDSQLRKMISVAVASYRAKLSGKKASGGKSAGKHVRMSAAQVAALAAQELAE